MAKILVLSPEHVDYLCDLTYHGLISLGSHEVYSNTDKSYMFSNYQKATHELYGRGFNYSKTLNQKEYRCLSNSDLLEKINNRFFDLIIYGSIHKYDKYLSKVISLYDCNQIVLLDGEDYVNSYATLKSFLKACIWYFRGMCLDWFLTVMIRYKFKFRFKGEKYIYFKREINIVDDSIPISFSIPKEKIVNKISKKSREFSALIPGISNTYIFDEENDYNFQYQSSIVALTFNKGLKFSGGWGTLRHYEILANGCIPFFPDLKEMPLSTMIHFPKDLVYQTNEIYLTTPVDYDELNKLALKLLEYTKIYLTTEYQAQYILSHTCLR